jgi:hypothetical protein
MRSCFRSSRTRARQPEGSLGLQHRYVTGTCSRLAELPPVALREGLAVAVDGAAVPSLVEQPPAGLAAPVLAVELEAGGAQPTCECVFRAAVRAGRGGSAGCGTGAFRYAPSS